MSIFRRIGNSLARFMYGRNGMDQLNLVLIWGCVVLNLAAMLLGDAASPIRLVVSYLGLAVWAWALFRMFSKNLYRRREENSRWLSFWWKLKNGYRGARTRHADKDHKYFTCKNCKTICRVPTGKGNIVITCPKCGAKIQAKT